MTFSRVQPAVVVDASAAVRFLLGESNWREAWARWVDEGAMLLAPAHFRAEVANGLFRSARLPVIDVLIGLTELARAGVEAVETKPPALYESVELADKHRLTVYDALYLQLAMDVEGELATEDSDLRAAAEAEGVTLVP